MTVLLLGLLSEKLNLVQPHAAARSTGAVPWLTRVIILISLILYFFVTCWY